MFCKDLHVGEAASLALAVEKKADLILLDDMDARNIADSLQIQKTGVIGILLLAKQQGLVKEIKPLLDSLREEANFWIQEKFYQEVISSAGESNPISV